MGEEIIIDPFDPERVNPNSYNLTLADELMVYDNYELDMKKRMKARCSISPRKAMYCSRISSTWDGRMNIQKRDASYRCSRDARPSGVWAFSSM